ncbi:SMP-30/gluconolactonase/LRE family protein [Kordia zhangzhouensis]|uniref:SMP-30/gluconolactonase/LRE family protein n=1 Tax=Kordia zhangzhouensis TaxID=1620405 RepID=UPI00062985C2|nr:SMP-30/gluconolactonase/LRE family protein [Kordia zhangzhouensis]
MAELEYEIPSKLGEGAIWDYRKKVLYWVDIEGKSLNIYSPKTKTNKEIKMPSRIGTVVPSEIENEAVVALEDGIYMVNIVTENISLLSDIEATHTENRFNDGKCDPNGNLWVGSMHLPQSKPEGSLYKINSDGEAQKMLGNITISNGIVWTKDKKTMYYIDTPTSNIRAFDYNEQNNTISNERIAVKVDEADGFPDGMTIDENDKLWVGLWNGNCIAQYDPITGKMLSKVHVPAHNVTSCAFGGENLDILYITTSSLDMNDEEKKQYNKAGSIFKIKLDTRGVRSTFFKKPMYKITQANYSFSHE